MSIATWKKKFYTKPPTEDMSLLECVTLGIKKFQGATKENLEKHELFLDSGHMFDNIKCHWEGHVFTFGWEECGFCLKFFDMDCIGCPIQQEFGHTCMDSMSGFNVFSNTDNPHAILDELVQIKANILNGKDYESNL